MAKVNFIYNGIITIIQCLKEDKLGTICQKFALKVEVNLNSLYFLYNGKVINFELTFYEQANSLDKQSNEMNILAIFNDANNKLKCPKCNHIFNLDNINSINNLKKLNSRINIMLNELKCQIALINVNDNEILNNKIRLINFLISDIIEENEKFKIEIPKLLNINNNINDASLDVNFDIIFLKPNYISKVNKSCINCSIALSDGRFAIGSQDKSITIYNTKNIYKIDLIIKEHNGGVLCLTQLSSGALASCSRDNSIKIFDININNYKVIQTLNYHTSIVYGIIELKDKQLVSCSKDNSIIFYCKDDNHYKKYYQMKTNGICWNIIQTKENELCYSEKRDHEHKVVFYDLAERKIISQLNKFIISDFNCFFMIANNLLLIAGIKTLYIINFDQHYLIREINVPDSGSIYSSCMINKNNFLTGDKNNNIKLWRIEDGNLKLISTKENAHDNSIGTLLKLRDGHILSGSISGEIKIW